MFVFVKHFHFKSAPTLATECKNRIKGLDMEKHGSLFGKSMKDEEKCFKMLKQDCNVLFPSSHMPIQNKL